MPSLLSAVDRESVSAAASAMARLRWSKASDEDRKKAADNLAIARRLKAIYTPERMAAKGYGAHAFARLKAAGWMPRWARAQARRAIRGETHGPGMGECAGSYGLSAED